ncbi:HD domain-containing protein [Candidatus Nomurabacteria bacterium]|nr:HD domain-containing protein [Candidatus Nomurabacteria bacterium]
MENNKRFLIEKAIEIALKAHSGQMDKAGSPYILHPLRVMLQMSDDEEKMAAILHDVVEDSDVSMDDLKAAGFPETVLQAVDLLTHKDSESYEEYLAKIKPNPMALVVKLADLEDNSRLERIKDPTEKDYSRIDKYKKALTFLQF